MLQCNFSVKKMVMERFELYSVCEFCIVVSKGLTVIEKLHTLCRTAKRDGVPFPHSFLM